jgi:WYL domain
MAGFRLPGFWKAWCKDVQGCRPVYPVKLRIAPQLISNLHLYLGEEVKNGFSEFGPDEGGWREVTIFYEHFFQARESILNLGRAAEVLEPDTLRFGVIDFAQQSLIFTGKIGPKNTYSETL